MESTEGWLLIVDCLKVYSKTTATVPMPYLLCTFSFFEQKILNSRLKKKNEGAVAPKRSRITGSVLAKLSKQSRCKSTSKVNSSRSSKSLMVEKSPIGLKHEPK